jgi:large subunit ribosomal protein L25
MGNGASDYFILEVKSRTLTGGSACRRMRRARRIPSNVYGLDQPPFMVEVNPKRIDELLRLGSGVNTLFQLSLVGENKTREAMIKELQRDPVSELPVHVDFIRVDPLKKVQVSIPIRLEGIPEGVKNEGGIIDFVNRVVVVECLPTDIPESVEVDISDLHVNQNASVSDLKFPDAVEVLDDPEQIVAVVVAPRVEEAAPVEEEAEAAEEEAEAAEADKAAGEGEAAPEADKKDKKEK